MEPRSTNPHKKTKDNIDNFNTLSTYTTNLSKILDYRFKSGSGITLFNNPNQLFDRLELLIGSLLAGNNGVIPEFLNILHILNKNKSINKEKLNNLIKSISLKWGSQL